MRRSTIGILAQQGADISSFDALAPTLLNVTRNISTEIDLAWTVNSTNLEGSRIYRSTDGVAYSAIGTVAGNTATYTATGLTAGGLYYFKVVAYKGTSESDPTNIYDTRFKITVDTTKAGSANNIFILPTVGGTYNYFVDWDDGGSEQNVTVNTSQSYTYSTPGIYQIKIRGTFHRIFFDNSGDKLKITSIDNWGTVIWDSFASAFNGCANLTGNYVDVPNLGSVTNTSDMFKFCALFNYNVSRFNTSTITNMYQMFGYATNFNQDISQWNIASVTQLGNMLLGTAFSIINYDKLLNSWGMQNVQNNVAFHAGFANYKADGTEEENRTHLVSIHGWTIMDGGKAFDNGKLVLTFDDGYLNTFNRLSLFTDNSISATFYIVSDWVGQANYVTWGNLQTMNSVGMDIQCHTKNHANLTTLNQTQLTQNLTDQNNAFVANSIPSPLQLAYPGGQYNSTIKPWVGAMRHTARATTPGLTSRSADKLALPIYSLDNITDDTAIKSYIDTAKSESKAIVLMCHNIDDTVNSYTTSASILQSVINYAKSKSLDIITMTQLDAMMP